VITVGRFLSDRAVLFGGCTRLALADSAVVVVVVAAAAVAAAVVAGVVVVADGVEHGAVLVLLFQGAERGLALLRAALVGRVVRVGHLARNQIQLGLAGTGAERVLRVHGMQ